MITHSCHTPKCSSFPIYGHDVRPVVHLLAAQNVSNDYLVPVHSRTNTRDSPVDAVVIGDFVRPDQPAAVLLDCEEIAGPIGEVNGVTVHCWSSRNVASRREHPFRFQLFDIGRADGVLSWLAPSVVEILSGYSPLARF